MSEAQEKGVNVTPRTLSTVLGLISLIVALYTGISTLNSYAFRVQSLEANNVQLASSVGKLSGTIEILNEKITGLTITINRIDDRYQQLSDQRDEK